jgi:hypothetical protein
MTLRQVKSAPLKADDEGDAKPAKLHVRASR